MNRQQRRAVAKQGTVTSEASGPKIPALYAAAAARHQAGRLAEAEPLYRAILAIDPDHAETNHSLGVLACQVGRSDLALPLIAKAIAAKGDDATFHGNYGNALKDQGQLDEAVASYRRAIAIKPTFADAHSNLGNALRGQGKLDEAVTSYQRAITVKPTFADAHGNLGAALQDQGRLAEAVASYRRAIALNPTFVQAHYNLGRALRDQGEVAEAIASYRRALSLKPDFAGAHNNLGNTLKDQGEFDEAVASYRRAIALKPTLAEPHYNLGVALGAQGRAMEAIASYEQALGLDPVFANARYNLGNIFLEHGRLQEAQTCFEQVLAIKPDYLEAHNNLGNAFKSQGEHDEAIASYRRALSLAPDYAEAHSNLGAALKERGRLTEALASCQRAIALDPTFADAHNNLGNALKELGRLDEAIASDRRALSLKPAFPEAYNNLGAALVDQGRLTEAVASYRRAVALKPSFAQAHNNLGGALESQGKLEEAFASFEQALAVKPGYSDAYSNLLMSQHYVGSISVAELLASARRFGAQFEDGTSERRFANDPSLDRRLRIGYVSADLRVHPVGFLLANVLEARDRAGFETFCYANQTKVDDMTRRLQAATDHWRMIVGVSDADVAAMILKDEIDILIDLSGHTAHNRLPVFALRAAPVQASWIGYFGTTGLGAMDYLIMDETTIPYGEERWCSEAVVRLPHGRFCYAPPDYAPAPAAARRGAVTFGSFNNVAKIGPEVVSLWADVLRAVPQSRLVLKWKAFDDEDVRGRLAAAFLAAGVGADQLELRRQSRHADMLAEYGDIDIALDPFPFGGGMTSCEALWMGLPIVTWPGDRPASRQTIGFLKLLGLETCVARSREDYVRIAAGLASDRDGLADLRRQLRPRMAASPLCDGTVFTPTLEAAFREMWRRWSAGEGAKGFAISAEGSSAPP